MRPSFAVLPKSFACSPRFPWQPPDLQLLLRRPSASRTSAPLVAVRTSVDETSYVVHISILVDFADRQQTGFQARFGLWHLQYAL